MQTLIKVSAVFTVIFMCVLALAQTTPPESVEQLLPFFPQFMAAFSSGDYQVMFGFVLMFLMALGRQYILPTAKINKDHLPFILAGVSALTYAGFGLMAPGAVFLEVVKGAFISAFVAAGAWDLFGKLIAKWVFGEGYVYPGGPEFTKKK
jgi:hypothetical protein